MATTKAALAEIAMAALLVLAGCAGPVTNGTDGSAPEDAATPDDGIAVGSSAGTVEFYVSDEENAINDFEHLEVTVTKVGLHRAGDGDDEEAEQGDEKEADPGDEKEADPEDDDEGDEQTEGSEPTEEAETETNATATATPTASPTPTAVESDREDEEGNGESRAGWVEYEVNETVDLTELKGPNATRLGSLAAPNGTYDKVFVYVEEIDATLESGEQVNVKLPSEKLQIKKGFTVGSGERVSFVFDISVKQAGNSGKYNLRPIVSESGTSDEVEIEEVDERADGDDERADGDQDDEQEADDHDDQSGDDNDDGQDSENETDATTDLTAEFQGPVKAGEDATVKVTGADGPVANATVEVNDEVVGTTDASGTISVAVPGDAEAVEVTVTKGDAEAELEVELEDTRGNDSLAFLAPR